MRARNQRQIARVQELEGQNQTFDNEESTSSKADSESSEEDSEMENEEEEFEDAPDVTEAAERSGVNERRDGIVALVGSSHTSVVSSNNTRVLRQRRRVPMRGRDRGRPQGIRVQTGIPSNRPVGRPRRQRSSNVDDSSFIDHRKTRRRMNN